MYLLPDSPLTTRWLTPEERTLAFERIARDTGGLAPNKGAIAGLKQAFGDYLLYIFALMQNLHLSACSYSTASSDSGWLSQLRHNHHPSLDMSTIFRLRVCRLLCRSQFRPFLQENMAYFPLYGRSTCGVHHLLRRDEYCSTLYRMLSVRHGSVWC
jgi:hypothetical protein